MFDKRLIRIYLSYVKVQRIGKCTGGGKPATPNFGITRFSVFRIRMCITLNTKLFRNIDTFLFENYLLKKVLQFSYFVEHMLIFEAAFIINGCLSMLRINSRR